MFGIDIGNYYTTASFCGVYCRATIDEYVVFRCLNLQGRTNATGVVLDLGTD